MTREPSAADVSRGGCGQLLGACLVACVLFVVNVMLFSGFYGFIRPMSPEWIRNERVGQILLFIGPVAMLMVEWRLFDALVEWLWPWREREP